MFGKKTYKGLTATGLGLGIALTSVIAAGAQETPEAQAVEEDARIGYVGTVASYDGSVLVVDPVRDDTDDVSLNVNGDTQIRTPGGPVAGVLEGGARVAVLGIEEDDGSWTALQIMVKPVRPTIEAITGAVVSREGDVITIQLPSGETKEVTIGQGQQAPEVGEAVTAFANRANTNGGRPEVTGMERADQVRKRLQGFLEDVSENRPDLPPAVQDARTRITDRLTTLLEDHGQRHVEMLQRIMDSDRIPDAAKQRIQTAIGRANSGNESAQQAIDKARDRLGLPERGPNNAGRRP